MKQRWSIERGGWRVHVVHTTGFTYDGEARASYNEARLSAQTDRSQAVLSSELRIRPTAGRSSYVDYWGNNVVAFQLDEPHSSLEITSEVTVETSAEHSPHGGLSLHDVRDVDVVDRYDELLRPSGTTTIPDEVVDDLLAKLPALDIHDTAEFVSDTVRSLLRYTPGVTQVHTSATEALEVGHGVCQDFSHVALGLLRRLGIPARYVSGYLHPDPSAEVGQTSVGESHAWVEYFAGAWNPLDPTSGVKVGPRHIVVARGREYDDAAPLKGIYYGAPASQLGVSVTISRLG